MKRIKYWLIISSILLVLVSSCNLPQGTIVVSETALAPAAVDQTQVAGIVASKEAAQTALANAVQSTLAAMQTSTPEFTLTPSLTLTPTLTFTQQVPTLSVSAQTNCRSGPGTDYDLLGIMYVGQTADVVGRSVYGDTWIIKLPSNPAITCWLWGQYATVAGNTAGLPVVNPPSTPTPLPGFTFSYNFWGVGPGTQCLYFNVTNTGGLTWESYSLTVRDVPHGDTGARSANAFVSYDNWCSPTATQLDLAPGETGTASVVMSMAYDPTGDQFEATLTLCSGNDQTGVCQTKTISFTF